MTKQTAVVICPGRGTYGKTELGYLHKYHSSKMDMIHIIDELRKNKNQESIWDLDGRTVFSVQEHLAGENSADLIYASCYGDFNDINLDEFEIVAITGNSMGWYLACACAGVFGPKEAIKVVNTMGSQMKDGLIGGQIIFPEVDENWKHLQSLSDLIENKLREVNAITGHEAYSSIYFGGLRVIGGNDLALKWLVNQLPKTQEVYPFKLIGNAAFHTPLLRETSLKAKSELPQELFSKPSIPLIDGRGKIWMPYSTNINDLWDYTLGHQVYAPYDFTRAIIVALREFAPDKLIITGPGMNLGGAVAQVLIREEHKNLKNKSDFKITQNDNPFVLAMGDTRQRRYVCSKN